MTARLPLTMIALLGALGAGAEETSTAPQGIELSPALQSVLRAEMAEIAGGVQSMALSLASGDWKSIEETSNKIRASYILEKELTAAQVEELSAALPEHFKRLDAQFHQRAGKLAEAAANRDSELAVFHYSRLLESCTGCHAAYAGERFPGFAAPTSKGHHQ